jgi:hypothetical protein
MKYLKNSQQINESVDCIESQIAVLKRLKSTKFLKNGSDDANCVNTLVGYYNMTTRKWSEISLDEINDKLKSLEEELEIVKKEK